MVNSYHRPKGKVLLTLLDFPPAEESHHPVKLSYLPIHDRLFPELQELQGSPPHLPSPLPDTYTLPCQEDLQDIDILSLDNQPPDYPTQRDSPDKQSLPWYRQVYGSDIDSDSSEYWTHNLSPSQNSM